MTRRGSLVGIDAHEYLASLRKLDDKFAVVCDELLNRFVVAEISKIAKDGHKPFRLEWKGVHVDFSVGIGWKNDALVLDLIRKEGGDDSEQT